MLTKPLRRVVLICLAFFAMAAYPVPADELAGESVELLARAKKIEELRTGSAAPFLLQAEIKATLNKKELPGNYKLFWWGPNRWQEAVALGDFRRMRDGVTDGYWQLRPLSYQPLMIFDLESLLDIPSMLEVHPRDTVRKPQKRKIGGVSLSCVEIDREGVIARQLCFDLATGLLVRAEIAEPDSERIVFDYAAAISISTNQYPSKLHLQRGNDFSLELSIHHLQVAPGVEPPPPMSSSTGFEFWRSCQDIAPPVLEKRVAPIFPDPLKRTNLQGTVSFYARIEPDGSISHLKTLYSTSAVLEHSAEEAIAQWRYKPASCQGMPVKAETVIDTVVSPQ